MADPFSAAVFPKVLAKYAPWATVANAVDAILPPETPPETRKDYIQRLAPNDLNDKLKLMDALVSDIERQGRKNQFRAELINRSVANLILRGILVGQIAVDDDGVADPANLHSLTNKVQPFLSSKSFFDGMLAARYRVCAIWIDSPVTARQEIVGTGFLIAPDLVMTAYHVPSKHDLLETKAIPDPAGGEPLYQDKAKAGSEHRLAFIFDYWSPVGSITLGAPPPGVEIVMAAPDWLEWSSPTHPQDGVRQTFVQPPADKRLDCVVIRLAKRVGAAAAGAGGGRLRGWQKLNGSARLPTAGAALAILQHPAGEAQMFDRGDIRDNDADQTRIFYSTNATNGSSGSPCFDATPDVIAFHNAGFPVAAPGTKNNQGIFISPVIAALDSAKPTLLAESRIPFKIDDGLWSLSDDPKNPEPILGRSNFKDDIFALFNPRATRRVVIVNEDAAVAATGNSGKSFSTRILQAIARRRPAIVVDFSARELRTLGPEEFLRELGRRIGLSAMDGMPEKPVDERQQARWCSNQLPKWFDDLLKDRATQASTAVSADAAKAIVGEQPLLNELIWISIDDVHKYPLGSALNELIAGMIGVTDTQGVIGPGLKALRWLIIGHIPDFVREKSIEYELDTVSQGSIGVDAWTACIKSAFVSRGEDEESCRQAGDTAEAIFVFAQDKWIGLADPVRTLKLMASGAAQAIEQLARQFARKRQ